VFVAQVDDKVRVEPGSTIELAVRCDHLHAFDSATGEVLGRG
jgi:hypothetical protein